MSPFDKRRPVNVEKSYQKPHTYTYFYYSSQKIIGKIFGRNHWFENFSKIRQTTSG